MNTHKGKSSIAVPLEVAEAGRYCVRLLYRNKRDNAENVLVELYAEALGNRLASMDHTIPEAVGEAEFFYDCGNDANAFFRPEARFLFGEGDFVEVSNRGTLQRVTAGAVEFLEADRPQRRFAIDSLAAEGHDQWLRFDEGNFRAYNVKGTKLHDNNQRKGELSLRYPLKLPGNRWGAWSWPKSEANSRKKSQETAWDPERSYHVRVYYPGKAKQDTRVPLTIRARQSSPIIQVDRPRIANAGALVRLDASKSYTVQRSDLQFEWKQVGGVPVEIADPRKPLLEFAAPRLDVRQFAWSSLCEALIRHPDFLFVTPPSFFETDDSHTRNLLLLVKLAQDLVGRPPRSSEVAELAGGMTLKEFARRYLDSQEFRDFYFHRIRLMFESQGTELQDEPARIWCHVAFEDRPFQEILTGEYTVGPGFEQLERPAHHGRTGVLTTRGFIQGKPGLPHYNYAAQVSMLFLGYVFEVPDEIVDQREGVTALGTTDPDSACYRCHKILTPLAFQRLNWADDGQFLASDENGQPIDASDRGAVPEYPFAGEGMEAFATQAVRKERFVRTMINTHVNFYFGRPLRLRRDERTFYKRLWDQVHVADFRIRELIFEIVTSPEYLSGGSALRD